MTIEIVDNNINYLAKIQAELHAPKGQKNDFGNYNYRSCEDILKAVKSILKELDGSIMLSDEIKLIGDRFYVMATATLQVKGHTYFNEAYARESEIKKGMDAAQITGAASSYARKYALAGLFAIDNEKDADTMDNSQAAPTAKMRTRLQLQFLAMSRNSKNAGVKKMAENIDKFDDVKVAKKIEELKALMAAKK